MKDTLTIKNENNEEKQFTILFKFISKDNNQEYITYTAYEKDTDGSIICYSSINQDGKLLPVTTEKELKMIAEILNTMTEEIKIKHCIMSKKGTL